MGERLTTFMVRIDGGEAREFESLYSQYSLAVLEAFGKMSLPYPCTVEIWIPDLVAAGYGPYFYRIDDFIDSRGNVYVAPSVMTRIPLLKENPNG